VSDVGNPRALVDGQRVTTARDMESSANDEGNEDDE